jgi:hypothetical protein
MDEVIYYLIMKNRLGKKDANGYYLYIDGTWVPDRKNVIMDHLMGYDPYDDSPYGFGSLSIMDEIEEITESRAIQIMNQ